MSDKASQPEVCAAPAESTELDDPAATQNRDMRGGAYLPLFAAINAVLGIHERCRFDSTPDGARIYGLINRHRRDGLAMPVRTTRDVKDNGRVETRYCLRDVIVLVRRERRVWRWLRPKSHGVEIPPDLAISPDLVARLDADLRDRMDDDPERIDAWERYAIKIPALEKERAELADTKPTTPGESKYKRERLAAIDREVAALEEHGHIAEPPAQTAKPTAAEAAPRKPRARPRKKAAASPLPD